MTVLLLVLGYLLLAPILGGLLAGVDRIVTARMQSRVGPPLLQPFYDVFKLMGKRHLAVNLHQNFYAIGFTVFTAATGAIFFAGGDLLLTIFAFTVAGVFLALGAYAPSSPYSHVGAQRELLQMLACEPMLILVAIGLYYVVGSFNIHDIATTSTVSIAYLPGIFFGFLFILTIKLRKSPFDLSTSHHGHQELVKGVTTEFAGPSLALIEIAHWYENVFLLGFIWLFFAFNPWIAAVAVVVSYLAEVLVDNSNARVTWKTMVTSSWVVTVIFGVGNLMILPYLNIAKKAAPIVTERQADAPTTSAAALPTNR
jgi:formate hydrogenlyase subunit 4